MTHKEMKRKVYGLIEELSPNTAAMTDDPDLAAKYNDVANQVMFRLARFKKIPKYVEMKVNAGDVIRFEDIEKACGYEVYQIETVCGVKNTPKASGTVYKILESGMAQIDLFVYPERITDKTKDNYEFELSPDALEIMPYGIAADLLKSDETSKFGSVYASSFENMLQTLDSRYKLGSIYIEGGVNI